MLNSVVSASEFSLDFKNDYDYETYLLIVGNKTPEDSELPSLLREARRVVIGLEQYTDTDSNRKRLESAAKYLDNLETYHERILTNLEQEDRYEENMVIWENDVQIVTTLVQETINEYIYYENRELQTAQEENRAHVLRIMRISIVIFAALVLSIIFISIFVPISITEPIEQQVRAEQRQLRKAEFELLQAQINPHFLYNTLNTIKWMATIQGSEGIADMSTALSRLMKNIAKSTTDLIPIKEEFSLVDDYFTIMKYRYGGTIDLEYVTEDEYLLKQEINRFSLQPIIENAIFHGIEPKGSAGKITIHTYRDGENLIIDVTDNGVGMSPEAIEDVLSGKSQTSTEFFKQIGVYNVNERIKYTFGDKYGIRITSEENKFTTMSFVLPFKEEDECTDC
jgi:two-component system sensor histidine kinase YesM